MTEPKKSIVRRSAGFLLSYTLPWRAVSRSASSVRDSLGRIGDAARGAAESMRADHERIQAAKQVRLTPEQQRMTPQERFADDVRRRGMSEATLAWRATQFQRAKWVCLMAAVVSFGGGLYMLTSSSLIIAVLMGPTAMIASLILVLRASLEAHKEAQIRLRAIGDFKWFMSRGDFFRRLVV